MDEELVPASEMPPEGPQTRLECKRCNQAGGLVIEHRREWADPPADGWPEGVAAARLAQACRSCGSDFLTESARLVALPLASLAGAMPKVAAREVPWLECEQCQSGGAAKRWPWMRCTKCGAESRAKLMGRY